MSDKKSNNTQKKYTSKPRIATLHNMPESSPDEEEGQAFYAGGSERSGQQVLGPPKRKNFREQLTDMLRTAQDSGAVVDRSDPSTSRGDLYQGVGLRLGEVENDHSVVTNVTGEGSAAQSQTIEPVKLKLWSAGFSINNSELRPYDDPQNKDFLETVMRGEIPNELRQMGSMVDVDLEDHRHEDFKTTAATSAKKFEGASHTLGSPTSNVEETIPTPQVSTSADSSNEENEKKANEQLGLQADQPTTMLQIRLSDGSRLSGRFNLTHTVNDIRQYIIASRPQYAFQSFILVTAFPTKELSDSSQTIQEAGLSNASLMQRLN